MGVQGDNGLLIVALVAVAFQSQVRKAEDEQGDHHVDGGVQECFGI